MKIPKIKGFKIQNLISVLVILVIGSFFYRNWFLFKPLASGDWGYFFEKHLKTLLDIPLTWSEVGLGNINIATRWTYPFDPLIGILARFLNLNFEVLEKLVFFWPFLLIFLGSLYFFSKVFRLTNLFFLLASIFCLINTYVLLLTSGGQMLFALGVAVFPLVFAVFHQAVFEDSWSKRILAGVFLVILTVFDPRVTYLALIAIFFYYLFLFVVSSRERKNLLINYLKIFVAVVPVFLGLMTYWWLPLVLTRDLGLPAGFGTLSQTKELSFATMANTITAFQPFWPENIFGKTHPTPFYFFLVPIFAFSAVLFRPKDKLVLFFSLLALIGIFLAKGAQEPLGEIYLFLNRFFPGFSFFRDPTKFFVLIVFSYAVLLATFAQEVFQRIKAGHFRYGFLIIFIAFLVFLSKEGFLGQLDGTFQPKAIPKEYQNYAKQLAEDKSFYRTFWLPQKFAFAYADSNHPTVEAWDLTEKKPISSFINHFYHRFTYLDSPAAEQFFDILGIRYLFVLNVEEQKFVNMKDKIGTLKAQERLIESLKLKDWLLPVGFFKNTVGFENKNYLDHFWLIDNIVGLKGSDKVYETLSTLPEFKLRNFAIFNADIIGKRANFLIVEEPKGGDKYDVSAIFIYNPVSGAEKTANIFVPKEDRYQIFARITKGEKPKFDQEEVPYGQIQSYLWQNLGIRDLKEGESILRLPEENIDRIILIPQDLSEIFAKSQPRQVEYQKINSTKYKIIIPKSESGGILAFSQAFHPLWRARIDGRKISSLALYGLVNGFPIDVVANGEQEVVVEFLPQRIVPYSLGVSAFTLAVVILVLSYLKHLERKPK